MGNPTEHGNSGRGVSAGGSGEELRRPEGGPADAGDRASGRGRGWSRRRFGTAALLATPVLATFYGRPLRAATNCTCSGWVSGNSSVHQELEDCGGNTPGYWQGPASKWQHPGWDEIKDAALDSPHGFPGLNFFVASHEGGGGGGRQPATLEAATLQQAVEGPGRTPFEGTDMLNRQLMRFGTAALLNARFVIGYSLTEAQVTEMVAMAVLHGGYTTPGGDYLTAEQVKAFLENTMDTPTWGP